MSAQLVSKKLNIGRSTAYRYLQSLRASGFLEEAGRGTYALGPQLFRLWRIAADGRGLEDLALPLMQALAQELDEGVILTRRVSSGVMCVARVDSTRRIRLSYEPGQLMPIYAGAHAYVLLAWEDEKLIEEVLAATEFHRLTDATITSHELFRERLASIRDQGYAVSRGETERHLVGIAAPVRGRRGSAVAGFGVAGLEFDFPDERVPDVAAAVIEYADRLSNELRNHGF